MLPERLERWRIQARALVPRGRGTPSGSFTSAPATVRFETEDIGIRTTVSDEDLANAAERVNKLRQQVAEAEATRTARERQQANAITMEQLKAEEARLQANLDAAKAGGSASAVKEGASGPLEQARGTGQPLRRSARLRRPTPRPERLVTMGYSSQAGQLLLRTQSVAGVLQADLASAGVAMKIRSGSLAPSRELMMPDPEIGGGRDRSDAYLGGVSWSGDYEFCAACGVSPL